MKKCSKCKVERKLEYFTKDSKHADGKKSKCKFCHAEYDKERQRKKKLDNIYSF
jgi:hypothetical protein